MPPHCSLNAGRVGPCLRESDLQPLPPAGDSLPMDVSSVHHSRTLLRYSVSLLGYGFYGDVVKDSEKKRWMGPVRYEFSGDGTRLRVRGG